MDGKVSLPTKLKSQSEAPLTPSTAGGLGVGAFAETVEYVEVGGAYAAA